MNAIGNLIPAGSRALTDAMRCALNGRTACPSLTDSDPLGLFRQAREQGVDTYLYPWLVAQKIFNGTRAGGSETPLDIWRQAFLYNLAQTEAVRQLLQPTLARLTKAGLDVILLKGAWLAATVYDDPAQRLMSDIDILVREGDLDAVHRELIADGFAADKDALHNRFAYDQRYRHPRLTLPLELHWHVTSDLTPAVPVPDIAAVWRNAVGSSWNGTTVKAMPPADQLAHIAQHILHHLFAAPLRGYLDIALLLKKHGAELSPEKLSEASDRWRTGRAVPFLVQMTASLLEIPLPRQLTAFGTETAPEEAETAMTALFNLPGARERAGESTLLDFRQASAMGKLALAWRRVFMPRQFMLLDYPCARTRLGLPLAWLKRALRLYRRNRSLRTGAPDKSTWARKRQEIARQRRQLAEKLLS